MKRLLIIVVFLMAPAVWAVEPSEMLSDPALESRAQALDRQIRCVQCQSESIASSNADWSVDARLMVRELIQDGGTDASVTEFFVERYGERVLMNPRRDGSNAVLWAAGPLMLLVALAGVVVIQRRRRQPATQALTDDDQRRLKDILDD